MVICIDFDGTCVTHEFPRVGNDIGAVPVLRELVQRGHRLVLFTMRSNDDLGASDEFPNDHGGLYLTDAVNWFKDNGISLYGVNRNPDQTWTTSPKAYGDLYIDDAALGCPLRISDLSFRPYVDWVAVAEMLIEMGVL